MLRTLTDFTFILFTLYGKDVELAVNYFAILIPLINSQNNSGKKNNFLGYILSIISLTYLDNINDVYNYKNYCNLTLLAPIIVVFCIDYFLRFRDKIKKLNEKLFEIIDGLYGVGFNKSNIFKVYEKLIDQLNQFKIIKRLNIILIACLVINNKNQKLILANASKMILNYKFIDEENLISELRDKKEAQGFAVHIGDETFENSQFFLIKAKRRSYCFTVIYKKNVNKANPLSFIKTFLTNDFILTPAFKHLARLFEIQRQVASNRYKSLENVSNKLDYVLKANEVMHFVKGSLSPIKDALTLSEQIDKVTTYEDKKFIKENFKQQRKAAKLEIQNIIDRSNFILAKSKNPFEADVLNNVDAFEIFSHIRRKWENRFFDNELIISGDNISAILDSKVKVNYEILDLILINIFSNINKYSIGGEQLEFNINFNEIKVIFYNLREFKGKNSKIDLEKLIDYFNKKNRLEISKRKTHGFVHLRTYTEAIGYESNMILRDNKYGFILEIKYSKDEDSNI